MKKIWLLILGCMAVITLKGEYYSQVGQDKYVNEHFFKNKRNGVFIDIGAHDGFTGSNSYFFEKELEWRGICFEPLPHLFEKLHKTRQCICMNACVAATTGIIPFIHIDSVDEQLSGMLSTYDKRQIDVVLNDIKVYGGQCRILQLPSVQLMKILAESGINHVDFLSCDTEGSELEIMKSIDFDKVQVDVITIENNYNEDHVRNYLVTQGFTWVIRLAQDDIFVRTDLLKHHVYSLD